MKKNWCESCAKRKYSPKAIIAVENSILHNDGLGLNHYPCPLGGGFHLTSKGVNLFQKQSKQQWGIGKLVGKKLSYKVKPSNRYKKSSYKPKKVNIAYM
jgi:hypothetical protein